MSEHSLHPGPRQGQPRDAEVAVFQLVSGRQGLTRGEDAIDELLPGDLPVLVFVDAPEEVHDAGFLVVHPAHILLPPNIEIEVRKFLQLEGNPRESAGEPPEGAASQRRARARAPGANAPHPPSREG